MGDPDGGYRKDRTKMHGQARPAGMIEPCRVDEQHVGYGAEPGHSRGEDRALPQGKQAGRVRGRNPPGYHRLVFDVRGTAGSGGAGTSEHVVGTPVWLSLPADGARAGPPRHSGGPGLVAWMPVARLASGEGHETPADDRGSRQLPWRSGQCGFGVLGQCHLELDQLVAGLRPWCCWLFHPATIALWRRGRKTKVATRVARRFAKTESLAGGTCGLWAANSRSLGDEGCALQHDSTGFWHPTPRVRVVVGCFFR